MIYFNIFINYKKYYSSNQFVKTKQIYNNIKTTSIKYKFFRFNYKYYLYIFYY